VYRRFGKQLKNPIVVVVFLANKEASKIEGVLLNVDDVVLTGAINVVVIIARRR